LTHTNWHQPSTSGRLVIRFIFTSWLFRTRNRRFNHSLAKFSGKSKVVSVLNKYHGVMSVWVSGVTAPHIFKAAHTLTTSSIVESKRVCHIQMVQKETINFTRLDSTHCVWQTYTELATWSWVLIEKLPVSQLLKNFPTFYGTRKFITYSQEPTIGSLPKPDLSSPYHSILLL
jgi:hypothetical protein